MFQLIKNYFSNNLSSIVPAGLIFIVTLILAKLLSFIITSNMKLASKSKKLSKKINIVHITKLKLIRRLLVAIIYFIGLAAILYQFESLRRLGAVMFTSASILGIIFGIAASTSLSNVIAGIIISFTQPVRLGDFIEIEGQEGKVEEITLTYTRIKTWDNKRLIIPNKQFFDSKIINHSIIEPISLVKVELLLDQKINFDYFKKIALGEIKKSKYCFLEKEPYIQIIGLEPDKIKIEIFAWTKKPEQIWDFSCEIRERLFKLLKKERLYL